jgi:DASS family divalent anion:Na+ symporter
MVLAGIIPSNAARSGGVVLPIARSIAELYGSKPGATAALLGSFLIAAVYQNICVTSAMFLTGQASNPLAAQIATQTLNYPVNWTNWFLAGLVPGLCSLALLPLVSMRLNPPEIRRTPEAASFAASELERMGAMHWRERVVSAIFAGVCLMWATAAWHRIDITATALVGSAALLLTGILKWDDVVSDKAAWDIFIWYGGLVRLGKALHEAGWVLLLAVALIVYFYSHYAFASITAHLLSMFPPFAAVLIARGAPAGLVVFAFACFVSLAAGLTHYGTTPSPMFYGQNYTSFRVWWKIGFACSITNLLVWTTVGFAWWKLIGIW